MRQQSRNDPYPPPQIAERGGMKLFLVDVALEQARQAGDRADLKKTALDQARRLIAETGYHRRAEEVQ